MSVSMMPTRNPARATSTARLAVVFDFPVPPRKECVEMIFDKLIVLVVRVQSRLGLCPDPNGSNQVGTESQPTDQVSFRWRRKSLAFF